jgi:anti-sigma-K factor RskA
MTGHDLFDDLAAAYALDALNFEDRRAFEAHLATCDVCRHTVGELARVSASIGLSADPVEPPVSLRAKTLARATSQPRRGPDVAVVRPRRPLSAVNPFLSFALAASLIGFVGVTVYAWMLQTELRASRETVVAFSNRAEALRAMLASARVDSARLVNTISVLRSGDLIRVDLRGQGSAPQATGRAFVSQAAGLVLRAEHLPRLAPRRTYQLWVVPTGSGAVPVSAGVFDTDAAGTLDLTVPLPRGIRMVAAVALTEEPAGGSVKATTAPLLLGAAAN